MSYLVKVNFKIGRGFFPSKIGKVLTQEQVNALGNDKIQELLKVGFIESTASKVFDAVAAEQVSEVSEPMPEIDEYNDEPKKKKRK